MDTASVFFHFIFSIVLCLNSKIIKNPIKRHKTESKYIKFKVKKRKNTCFEKVSFYFWSVKGYIKG